MRKENLYVEYQGGRTWSHARTIEASCGNQLFCRACTDVLLKLEFTRTHSLCTVEMQCNRNSGDQVQSLDHLHPGIQNESTYQLPNTIILKTDCYCTQREEDMPPFFNYELTAMLTSLFSL